MVLRLWLGKTGGGKSLPLTNCIPPPISFAMVVATWAKDTGLGGRGQVVEFGRIWTDCTNRVNGCGVDQRRPGADLSRPRRQDAQTPRETGAPAPLGVAAYSVLSSWVGSLTLMEVIL